MKCALVIGNSRYGDRILAQLHTPDADARALAGVLTDPQIGGFDQVTPIIDRPQRELSLAILNFLKPLKPEDLALLYFSGHGVLDNHGQLYLAAADTEVDALPVTGIPASFLVQRMDDCRARKQILILDCCHSGAFAQGTAKGAPAKAVTEASFQSQGGGSGRVVLTASDSMQSSWEGDRILRQSALSLFTHFLLEGLKTGAADANNDGWITLDEWYDYAYGQVIARTPNQAPQIWAYRQQGDIKIARNRGAQQAEQAPDEALPEVSGPPAEPGPTRRARSKAEPSRSKPARKRAAADASAASGGMHLLKKFDASKSPLCDACGAPLLTVLRREYYHCPRCERNFHNNFTCVETRGKSVQPAPRYSFLKTEPIATIEYMCKFCHIPLELVHDFGLKT